jgi:hypothetical protein
MEDTMHGLEGEMTVVVHGYMGHVHDDVEELLRWQVMIAQ